MPKAQGTLASVNALRPRVDYTDLVNAPEDGRRHVGRALGRAAVELT
jgi:hypothetical protein